MDSVGVNVDVDTQEDVEGEGEGEDDDDDEGVEEDTHHFFSHLTPDDITHYARILTRIGGSFMSIGDSADAGASWESDCRHWVAQDRPESQRGPDPRNLSTISNVRSVSVKVQVKLT